MKLAVCFALALVGCTRHQALPTPPATDLAEPAVAGDDLAPAASSGDDLLTPAADDLASSPPAPDLATPPDLWMCTPLDGDCDHVSDCCAGMDCGFPSGTIQPQHICCYPAGHACSATSDCCYGAVGQSGSYCNQAIHQCTPNS